MAGGTKDPQNQRRGEMPSRSEDAEYPRSSDDPLAVRVKTASLKHHTLCMVLFRVIL